MTRIPEPTAAHRSKHVLDYVENVMIDFTQMKEFSEDPLILTEGAGVRVRDVRDRWYFDGISGTFCLSLGHGNTGLVEAAASQLARLAVAAPTMATSDRSLELAKTLLELLPPELTHVKWGSGGSEAVEAGIKLARQYHLHTGSPRRVKVLSHYRAYHGVTGMALAASGWAAHKTPYEPLASGFLHVHAPDSYRPLFDVDPQDLGRTYARLVEEVIEHEGPDTIAAFMTEPVMMSAGVLVPPRDYLPRIRELCDRYGIVLIFDEVITGFGRIGRLFASELFETWPDILVLGKGISGGYAGLSATVVAERIAKGFWGDTADNVHFAAGHTYAGNPVACAVGLEAIRQIVDGDLSAHAARLGALALERLRGLQAGVPAIGDVRGEGLLFGVEFVTDRETRQRFPAADNVGVQVREAAKRRGLLLRASHWMAVLAPPLTTSEEELDAMLSILEDAIRDVFPDRPGMLRPRA